MTRLIPVSTAAILAASTLLFATGCSDSGEDGGRGDGSGSEFHKTYVHSMDGAPSTLDPAQASSIYANFLAVNLYDTLYRYKYLARPYELTPNLAASLPEFSDDGLTLTIRLKTGVNFIDDPAFPEGKGREVTAGDFVYSLLRHFDPRSRGQGAWLWQNRIEGLDQWKTAGADYDNPPAGLAAIDRHTLRIRLSRPYPQIVHTLTQGYSAIVPREAVERYGRELGSRAVGSGPFRLVSFDSSGVRMERNGGFREEPFSLLEEGFAPDQDKGLGMEALEGRSPPFVDRLEVEFIAEDASRWNSFYAGQTQFLKAPAAQFSRILASLDPPVLEPDLADRFNFQLALESGFVFTNMNMADSRIGPVDDPEQSQRNRALRCAIIKGFDWARRNEQFFGGVGKVFPGIITPGVPEFDPDLDRASVTHDPDGARALLEANGWTRDNLPVLEYGFPSSVTERQMFDQFRGYMEQIGFDRANIRPRVYATFGDYYRAYSERKVMLMTSSWTLDYPDAENTMQLFYGPNVSPGSNSSNYDNPDYNELFKQAAVLPASPERTALYRRMNQMVIDDCVTISGLARRLLLLWDKSVTLKPDRSFVGGYTFRFVDVPDPPESTVP